MQSPLLQLLHKQRPNRIEHRDDHNAHICKDRHPHIRDSQGSQRQKQKLDANGKHNVLVHDAQAFSGNLNGFGNLQRIVIH